LIHISRTVTAPSGLNLDASKLQSVHITYAKFNENDDMSKYVHIELQYYSFYEIIYFISNIKK
jgi:hypothetical protein